ncbi:hypothetical protein PR048_019454 [Dryococelus australis]|uniref:PiggyBac transposable element-derived protein domain-containing protein n=1 Tax=Dryococelus australis TaxID=614101 RepID=A0ABQ9H3I9_9NEOP|nr:hypothetical protein PR048_019454 [Dryococelus australis]
MIRVIWRGINNYKWAKKNPPAQRRTRVSNIATKLPVWGLLTDDDMIQSTVEHTNKKITHLSASYGQHALRCQFTQHTDKTETEALLVNPEDSESLFSADGTGHDIYRAVLSLKSFLFLLLALRFDDVRTRQERSQIDRLTSISAIFYAFIHNSQSNYSRGQYMSINEMLFPFRGSKSAKYGLEEKTLIVNKKIIIRIPTLDVLSLVQQIVNSNRNVNSYNWFSSIENEQEVPASFQPNRVRAVHSSIFGFTRNTTIVSHIPKMSKNIDANDGKKKPETISFHNITKAGNHALDQKCANYYVGLRTRLRPLVIWFALMNIAGVNAYIIKNDANYQHSLKRRQFLVTLGQELIHQHLQCRSEMTNLPRDLLAAVRSSCQSLLFPTLRSNVGVICVHETWTRNLL